MRQKERRKASLFSSLHVLKAREEERDRLLPMRRVDQEWYSDLSRRRFFYEYHQTYGTTFPEVSVGHFQYACAP